MTTAGRPILLSGSLSYDFIGHYPGSFSQILENQEGSNVSLSFLVQDLTRKEGGIAANIAYTLARLGTTSTILTGVGKDASSYLAKLESMGIDLSHIIISEDEMTACFMASVDRESGQIGWFNAGAMKESVNIGLDKWQDTDAIIVCSAHQPETMRRHVTEAKQYGLMLVYDPGQQVITISKDDLRTGVESADILMINNSELSNIANKLGMQEKAILTSVPITVVTLGSAGSQVWTRDQKNPIQIDPVQGITVVDVTGAGDAYRGGFLYGYNRGQDLKTCGRLGSVAASFAIEQNGAQGHLFTPVQFRKRYNSTYGENYD